MMMMMMVLVPIYSPDLSIRNNSLINVDDTRVK